MSIVTVKNIKGYYEDGKIYFSWRLPDDAPANLHIYRIFEDDDKNRYISGKDIDRIERTLRISPFSEKIPCQHDEDTIAVYTYLFCLTKNGETVDDFDLNKLLYDPLYIKTIVAGEAELDFQVKSKFFEPNIYRHIITLQSNITIPEGLIEYSFTSEKQRFSVLFPDVIHAQKIKYEPFYTFEHKNEDANIVVESVEHAREHISIERKKPTWLQKFNPKH